MKAELRKKNRRKSENAHNGIGLPRIASTCPFRCNFEVEDLWMVEHFVCVPLVRWSIATLLLHVMPVDLSANE